MYHVIQMLKYLLSSQTPGNTATQSSSIIPRRKKRLKLPSTHSSWRSVSFLLLPWVWQLREGKTFWTQGRDELLNEQWTNEMNEWTKTAWISTGFSFFLKWVLKQWNNELLYYFNTIKILQVLLAWLKSLTGRSLPMFLCEVWTNLEIPWGITNSNLETCPFLQRKGLQKPPSSQSHELTLVFFNVCCPEWEKTHNDDTHFLSLTPQTLFSPSVHRQPDNKAVRACWPHTRSHRVAQKPQAAVCAFLPSSNVTLLCHRPI